MRLSGTFYLICMLLLVPTASLAALVSADLNNTGDGLLTVDTDSGLEWLDLDQSAGLSFNQIMSGTGGWLDQGFRIATFDEARFLFDNSGLMFTTYGGTSHQNKENMTELLSLLGVELNPQTGTSYFHGFTEDFDPVFPGTHRMFYFGQYTTTDERYWLRDNMHIDPDYAITDRYGAFMVRETVVPAPAASWLFLSGLLFLGKIYHRR